jgi:hypothetical protein
MVNIVIHLIIVMMVYDENYSHKQIHVFLNMHMRIFICI